MVKRKVTNPQRDQQIGEQVIFNQQNSGIGSASNRGRQNDENNHNSNPQSEAQKVYQLARKSSQVLFRTKTVFPFDFFPDILTINANKIDIVNTSFFFSHQTTSIPLPDIANIEIQTSPFFATLRIINIRYPMHPLILRYLKKSEAVKAKNIIDGLLVAISQGTDITEIEPKQFLKELEKVGESAVKNG